ncbi:unnamed protein product [Pieris macdunnoughi]|uniref:Uncharacterized protein n=1 Tax=Pieris macdunnoughi TaxID=345717 RepID=A0A821S3Z4_9NEOP|nr:unnamed protein product [Pieris macdunnoughi]
MKFALLLLLVVVAIGCAHASRYHPYYHRGYGYHQPYGGYHGGYHGYPGYPRHGLYNNGYYDHGYPGYGRSVVL